MEGERSMWRGRGMCGGSTQHLPVVSRGERACAIATYHVHVMHALSTLKGR